MFKRGATKVYLYDDQFKRWRQLSDDLHIDTDKELAALLLDNFFNTKKNVVKRFHLSRSSFGKEMRYVLFRYRRPSAGCTSFFLLFYLSLNRKESIHHKRIAHKATTPQIKHKYPFCLTW